MSTDPSTTISNERLAELEAADDEGIDLAEVAEADEAFFRSARLRLPGEAARRTFAKAKM